MNRRFIILCLLMPLAGCRQDTPTSAQTDAALDHLLEKMNERLALMEAVANFKRLAGKPIADPDREAALLNSMEEKAKTQQFDPRYIRRFFTAQIEAAKILQENHLERWKANGTKDTTVPSDLSQIRQRIDAVNDELLIALAVYRKHTSDRQQLEKRAAALLTGEGIDDRVRSAAVEPLLNSP